MDRMVGLVCLGSIGIVGVVVDWVRVWVVCVDRWLGIG